MTTLFDLDEGERRKQKGMELAAGAKVELLEFARSLGAEIACGRDDRTCTADDIQAALSKYGLSPANLGPAAGLLFRTPGWQWTGRRVRSAQVHNHAREIKVWRYIA